MQFVVIAGIGITMHPGMHLLGAHDSLALTFFVSETDYVNDIDGHIVLLDRFD